MEVVINIYTILIIIVMIVLFIQEIISDWTSILYIGGLIFFIIFLPDIFSGLMGIFLLIFCPIYIIFFNKEPVISRTDYQFDNDDPLRPKSTKEAVRDEEIQQSYEQGAEDDKSSINALDDALIEAKKNKMIQKILNKK